MKTTEVKFPSRPIINLPLTSLCHDCNELLKFKCTRSINDFCIELILKCPICMKEFILGFSNERPAYNKSKERAILPLKGYKMLFPHTGHKVKLLAFASRSVGNGEEIPGYIELYCETCEKTLKKWSYK